MEHLWKIVLVVVLFLLFPRFYLWNRSRQKPGGCRSFPENWGQLPGSLADEEPIFWLIYCSDEIYR